MSSRDLIKREDMNNQYHRFALFVSPPPHLALNLSGQRRHAEDVLSVRVERRRVVQDARRLLQ